MERLVLLAEGHAWQYLYYLQAWCMPKNQNKKVKFVQIIISRPPFFLQDHSSFSDKQDKVQSIAALPLYYCSGGACGGAPAFMELHAARSGTIISCTTVRSTIPRLLLAVFWRGTGGRRRKPSHSTVRYLCTILYLFTPVFYEKVISKENIIPEYTTYILYSRTGRDDTDVLLYEYCTENRL